MENQKYTYRAEVRVAIQKVSPQGSYTSDRLTFEDTTELGALNFAQISDLLMRFHHLSETAVAELNASA